MSRSTDSSSNSAERAERIRLLMNDCIDRRTAGETVRDAELLAAHPDLMPELEEALRDVQLIQQAQRAADEPRSAGLQIRCPHCHEPMEVIDDRSLSDLLCPSCGSQFSLTDDSDQTFKAGEQMMVNHFQLLERVGVGAFGVVWKARDNQLDRIVALKIPRKGHLSTEETEQFVREARAAAQLKHPHIVSVLEVGRFKDRIYLACDFIEGLDLADWLVDGQPTARESADLCATLADALAHAHQHGVIHRDLKPSNIMLDAEGEPHVMDFGLAKRESGEVTMTVDGKLLGTPAYMSPEQARGDAHHADARSDVYSLGVILFEMLTGERPFRGNTRMLLQQILLTDAPNPRQLNDRVPRDLANICLKCLEKEPSQRYANAGNLRDDLKRFLNGKPVVARPLPTSFRVWKWARRHPAHAFSISLAFLIAVASPFVAILIGTFTVEMAPTVAMFYPSVTEGESLIRAIGGIRLFNVILFCFSLAFAAIAASAATCYFAQRHKRLRVSLVLGYALLTGSAILLIGTRFYQTRAIQRHVDLVHASGGSVDWPLAIPQRQSLTWSMRCLRRDYRRQRNGMQDFLIQDFMKDFIPEVMQELWCLFVLPPRTSQNVSGHYLVRVVGECVFARPKGFDLGPSASDANLSEVFSSGVWVDQIEFEELSSSTLELLSAQTQPVSLKLSGSAITDDVLRRVAPLPNLGNRLELSRTRVTAEGISQLGETTTLDWVRVETHTEESDLLALNDHHRLRVQRTRQKRGQLKDHVYNIRVMEIPERSDHAGSQHLNLNPVYTSAFSEWTCWIPARRTSEYSLIELPTGIQTFAGISYDVRGVVDLEHDVSSSRFSYPIKSSSVKQIHFLHGVEGEARVDTVAMTYILRYADGAIENRPIVIGKDVLELHATRPEGGKAGPTVAWSGSNDEIRRCQGRTIQLYTTTWKNPRPGVEVVSLELGGALTPVRRRPFLVAVTVE